jgi:hypothetical protein
MKAISISGIIFNDPDYVDAVLNRMKTYKELTSKRIHII